MKGSIIFPTNEEIAVIIKEDKENFHISAF